MGANGHSDSTSLQSRASSLRAADIEDEGQESPDDPKRPMSAKKRNVRIADGHTELNGDTKLKEAAQTVIDLGRIIKSPFEENGNGKEEGSDYDEDIDVPITNLASN